MRKREMGGTQQGTRGGYTVAETNITTVTRLGKRDEKARHSMHSVRSCRMAEFGPEG